MKSGTADVSDVDVQLGASAATN